LQVLIQQKAESEVKRSEAKQRRANVTAMFATDVSANTLLFDMTQLVNRINPGVQGDDFKPKITKFEPDIPLAAATVVPTALNPDILTDTSFGPFLVGKLIPFF
jgi:type IV pilus assembly protein PilO